MDEPELEDITPEDSVVPIFLGPDPLPPAEMPDMSIIIQTAVDEIMVKTGLSEATARMMVGTGNYPVEPKGVNDV